MAIESFGTMHATVHVLVMFSVTFKLIVSSSKQKAALTGYAVLIWATIIGVIVALIYVEALEPSYKVYFEEFFDSGMNLTLILCIGSFNLTINYGYWNISLSREYYPVGEAIARSRPGAELGGVAPYNRKSFLGKFILSDTFTSIYRKCFNGKSEINVVILNLLTPTSEKDESSLKRSLTLRFSSTLIEKRYMIYVMNKFVAILRAALLIGAAGLFTFLVADYVIFEGRGDTDRLLNNIFIFLLLTGVYLSSFELKWSRRIRSLSVIFLWAVLACSICYCIAIRTEYSLLGTIVLVFVSVNYSISLQSFVLFCLVGAAGVGGDFALNYQSIGLYLWNDTKVVAYPIISISFVFVSILVALVLLRYKNEKLIKEEFTSGATLDSTLIMVKELLSLLLPKFVLDRMQNFYEITGQKQVFDDDDLVSIMFCDIADFDEVVKKSEDKIVNILDQIFRKFDDLCMLHGIQKIETVGKTYMAASGLKSVESSLPYDITKLNPTLRILNFSKDMMAAIEEHPGLKLKIGLHVGKPVMGVIGYHKPQFSLIGDVVNTTSRHCTTGAKAHIMMSEAAWDMVKEFNPESLGYKSEIVMTFMKGKGDVPVYHLFKSKNNIVARIQNIINRKDSYKGREEKQWAECLSKMVYRVIQKKKKSKEGGNKFLQLIAQLRSSQTLGKLYTKFSVQPQQPTILATDMKNEDDKKKRDTQVISSGGVDTLYNDANDLFSKDTELFEKEEEDDNVPPVYARPRDSSRTASSTSKPRSSTWSGNTRKASARATSQVSESI